MFRQVKTSARRSTEQIRNLERSQEFGIFYEQPEVKSKTSTVGFVPVQI